MPSRMRSVVAASAASVAQASRQSRSGHADGRPVVVGSEERLEAELLAAVREPRASRTQPIPSWPSATMHSLISACVRYRKVQSGTIVQKTPRSESSGRMSPARVDPSRRSAAADPTLAHAVRFGDVVYTSGAAPSVPETHEIPEGFEAQARQVFANLETVLVGCGTSIRESLKLTVYLADIADWAAMSASTRSTSTRSAAPARTTVEVSA